MRADGVPVQPAGIAAHDVPAGAQGQGIGADAESLGKAVVHLVLGQPERERGGVAGEVVNLYTIELLQADV